MNLGLNAFWDGFSRARRKDFFSGDAQSTSRLRSGMKDLGGQDCEGDYRSWHIAICSSDAAMDSFVAFS